MPKPIEAELSRTLQELARIRRRLTRVNQHKLPFYWNLQPRVFEALQALQNALQSDVETLAALQQNAQTDE